MSKKHFEGHLKAKLPCTVLSEVIPPDLSKPAHSCSPAQEGHSDMLVHTCVNKKNEWGVFFCIRMRHAGNTFRGLKCHFSGKRGGFVKIYSNSSDSDLFRRSNLKQNLTKALF